MKEAKIRRLLNKNSIGKLSPLKVVAIFIVLFMGVAVVISAII